MCWTLLFVRIVHANPPVQLIRVYLIFAFGASFSLDFENCQRLFDHFDEAHFRTGRIYIIDQHSFINHYRV